MLVGSQIKLADFGFAAPIEGRDGSGLLNTHLGSERYFPPEILNKSSYRGDRSDIFTAGIILFLMISGQNPFLNATVTDTIYKYVAGNKISVFWKFHLKNQPPNYLPYSTEVQDLISGMLQYEPNHRPSINEVLGHKWFTLPVPS